MPRSAKPDQTFERSWTPPRPSVRTALEGVDMVGELPPGVGWLCWSAVRLARLWAATPPSERHRLFDEAQERTWNAHVLCSNLEARAEAPLLALGGLLGSPRTADPELIALALRRLALWAEGEAAAATAASLSDAAARSTPGDPTLAYEAGRLSRRIGDQVLAEQWLQHGLTLARAQRNHVVTSQCLLGLGNLHRSRGRLRLAHRLHLRGLRSARRAGSSHLEGLALHDLFVVASERSDFESAERWASEASRAYGPAHPRFPALAHDVGYLWMLRGHFAPALEVFEALQPLMEKPEERLRVVAHSARAAGCAGDRHRFEAAWAEVVAAWDRAAGSPALGASLADAIMEIAQGALALRDHDRACWAAERAIEANRTYRQGRTFLIADGILEAARNGRSAASSGAPSPQPSEAESLRRRRQDLAESFVSTLRARAAAAHE
jgi:tetratricopeptide (TPR) repeat protein